MPTVTITTPNDAPQRVVISPNRETALFGRSSKCDVRISCESVSARHATLRRMRDGYVLRDLGSTNGTKLDGEKVSEIRLKAGQKIHLGDVAFQFEPDAGDSTSPSKSNTQTLEAEGTRKPKVRVQQGPPPSERESLVLGLAAVGAGLVALGLLVLLGLDAFLAIAQRDQNFIIGGSSLILVGLLCLASILFVTGKIRLPRLVLQFGGGEQEEEPRRKRNKDKKKRRESKDEDDSDDDFKEENEAEDSDDEELGKAPKGEDADKPAKEE